MRWTKGRHAFIVATHVDKAHIHNHIIYNSTSLDNKRKFHNFFLSSIALQRVSDLVCLEHGLSVIKPRRYDEREKRTVYPNRKSIRDKIREDIDLAMTKNPKNMNELLKFLEEMGYEIKRAKHIGIKGNEQKSFIRIDSLGKGYREFDFEKIFKGEESFNPPPREKQSHRYEKPEKKFDMLIDIQEIIAKGKGPGYERWAKVHNIKQISQTLIYLRDHEGRGIGLINKLKAYKLQEEGQDTVEANVSLGFAPDLRNYGVGAQIISDLGFNNFNLITNNPRKIVGLKGYGLTIHENINIKSEITKYNEKYISTKCEKMHHIM